jgi:hypothetical protein
MEDRDKIRKIIKTTLNEFLNEQEVISNKRVQTLATKPFSAGELMAKLKKSGFIEDSPRGKVYTGYSEGFNIRVLIKGDGDEMDRTFDLNLSDPTDIAVMAYPSYSEESDWIELYLKDIQEIIQDLNK